MKDTICINIKRDLNLRNTSWEPEGFRLIGSAQVSGYRQSLDVRPAERVCLQQFDYLPQLKISLFYLSVLLYFVESGLYKHSQGFQFPMKAV
jgi:hypothetical protein